MCQKKTSDCMASHVDAADSKIALGLLAKGRTEKRGIINGNNRRKRARQKQDVGNAMITRDRTKKESTGVNKRKEGR